MMNHNLGDDPLPAGMTVAPPKSTIRQQVLRKAEQVVMRDRNQVHGPPEDLFSTIAEFWTTYLTRSLGGALPAPIAPEDVPAMMGLMKTARIAVAPQKADNWVDLAGYASCGAEVAKAVPES